MARLAGAPANAAAGVRMLRSLGDIVTRGEPLFVLAVVPDVGADGADRRPSGAPVWVAREEGRALLAHAFTQDLGRHEQLAFDHPFSAEGGEDVPPVRADVRVLLLATPAARSDAG